MITPSRAADGGDAARRQQAITRVWRNFWLLVTATVIAVGVLSQAIKAPASAPTAALVAVSGLAAVTSLALAGRILTITTSGRRRTDRRWRTHRHSPLDDGFSGTRRRVVSELRSRRR